MSRRAALALSLTLAVASPALSQGPAEPRLDRYGDPLPDGAVARLGTARFRRGELVSAVAFTPDGKGLACACRDRTIRLWDIGTGAERHRFYVGRLADGRAAPDKPSWRPAIALTPDGKTLAGTSADGSVRLWQVATGKEVHRFGGDAGLLHAVALAGDGNLLATGGQDRSVRLWDLASGRELRRFDGHDDEVSAVAFAPGSKVLASASQDGAIRIWEAASGKLLHQLKKENGPVDALVWSADGKRLLSLNRDLTAWLWDAATGRALDWLDGAAAATFAPDGKALFLGGGFLRAWDLAARKETARWGVAFQHWYGSVAISPDGKTLAAGVTGGILLLPLPLRSDGQARLLSCVESPLRYCALSPDGQTAITASGPDAAGRRAHVSLWHTATGEEARRIPARDGEITALALAPDGLTLATSEKGEAVRLWATATGKELACLQDGCRGVSALAFSPDGQVLAAGGKDGKVRLWETATGKVRRRLAHSGSITGLAFTPDGRSLSGAGDGSAHLWELATGSAARPRAQPGVVAAAVTGDGRALTLGSSPQPPDALCLWDLSSAKPVRELRDGQSGEQHLAAAPDGRSLASGSDTNAGGDRTVRLWEVATGQVRRRWRGHADFVQAVAFAPDGRLLVSASEDGTALVWDVAGLWRRRPADRLSDARLETLWKDLGRADAGPALDSMRELAAAPTQAVALFRKQLRPVPAVEPERLARLVADLDSPRFAARQQAVRALEVLGEVAEGALQKARAKATSLEGRRRAELLLAKLERLSQPVSTPTRLSALRALEVLEWVGDAEARKLLAELARGASEARLTREARAGLERLSRRPAQH
jgi:WD40 repeat protein